MKNLDKSTVGGRIRKCRMDSAQNQKELAKQVGISANYLGLVERGEKNASIALLREIAKVTGVSYKWLYTGEEDQPEASKDSESEIPVFAANVNPQFVLALALRSPYYNKETLAALLMVPAETVDRILAGQTVEYNPMWGNIFPVLLQGLDIPAVRQELRTLDAFLAKADDNASRMKLLQALQEYVNRLPGTKERPRQEYKIAGAVENKVEDYDTENGESLSVTSSRMMLESVATPNQNWYFAYFPFRDSVTEDTIEEVFQDELGFAERASNIGSASIVVSSKTVFQKFDSCVDKYIERCNQWQHAPEETVGLPAFTKYFSVILIDDSLKVIDEANYEDVEYNAAMEEIYGAE